LESSSVLYEEERWKPKAVHWLSGDCEEQVPLTAIGDLFDQLAGVAVFSKIELRLGSHQLKIKKEDVSKTAFSTRYSHDEFLILPFRLTNAPTFFMDMMNRLLIPYLDKFAVTFIDDILVHSRTKDEHVEHLLIVLKTLQEHKLYAKFKKCDFWMEKIYFVGYVISKEEVLVDPAKVKVVVNWLRPTNIT